MLNEIKNADGQIITFIDEIHTTDYKYIAHAFFFQKFNNFREQIVEAALSEDVNVVALSLLSGAHNTLFPKIVELLKEKGMGDVLVIGGGVIPDADIPGLKKAGVAAVFTPGTPTGDIVNFIKENVK